MSGLARSVAEDVSLGCYHNPRALGAVAMPEGYALMLNADRSHYYWLRHDAVEGSIDWNRWRVRRSAIANSRLVVSAEGAG